MLLNQPGYSLEQGYGITQVCTFSVHTFNDNILLGLAEFFVLSVLCQWASKECKYICMRPSYFTPIHQTSTYKHPCYYESIIQRQWKIWLELPWPIYCPCFHFILFSHFELLYLAELLTSKYTSVLEETEIYGFYFLFALFWIHNLSFSVHGEVTGTVEVWQNPNGFSVRSVLKEIWEM